MALIGSAVVDMQVLDPQEIPIVSPGRYIVRGITVAECTARPVGAVGGITDGPDGSGNVLVEAGQSYAALSQPTISILDLPLAPVASRFSFELGSLYLLLASSASGPSSATIYVWGEKLD